MLDQKFRSERAKLVRKLADQAIDPFIKKRLLGLVGRYEGPERRPQPNTPVDLQIVGGQGTGSERGDAGA